MTEANHRGSLTIVGLGIKYLAHMTVETKSWIESADIVYYSATDPFSAQMVKDLNANVTQFPDYLRDTHRMETYKLWAQLMVDDVRAGKRVTGVFYGHPGVYVSPSFMALNQLREEGFNTRMLPGISAEDCLMADYGVDLARKGYSCYEATQLLHEERNLDTAATIILWQIGVVGVQDDKIQENNPEALTALCSKLAGIYGEAHEIVVYEAAQYVTEKPRLDRVDFRTLPSTSLKPYSTLIIPPKQNS